MTMTIDISPAARARLEEEATRHGQEPTQYLQMAVEGLFLPQAEADELDAGWASLEALLDRCQADTGLSDLAHQHDHYIHDTPKRKD